MLIKKWGKVLNRMFFRQHDRPTVGENEISVVLDEDAFSNIEKFHDGRENIDEDDVSDESVDVAEEDWAGLD